MSTFRFYDTKENSELYVIICINRYENKNLRVDLWEGGIPFLIISMFIEIELGEYEFILCSEQNAQEILLTMIKNGLVKDLNKKIQYRDTTYNLYELTLKDEILMNNINNFNLLRKKAPTQLL
jgi:hypothetical protein